MNPLVRLLVGAALCVAGSGAAAGCGGSVPDDGGGSASCAAVIEYDGATYWGAGAPRRTLDTTGRTLPAVLPGCDDSGGQDPNPVGDRPVQVQELAAVDASVAVLYGDGVYVRKGAQLPDSFRAWFRSPRCSTPGVFQVTADWLGVTGPHAPRFDGDIRLPYDLEVRVTDGPQDYIGATVTIRATRSTDPGLAPADVKQSLWEGGQLAATLRCVDGKYDVVGVRTIVP